MRSNMSELDGSIDSLLDGTLDDLEDLPSFEPYPAGIHRALVSFEIKDVNGVESVEMSMKGVETIELSNPTTDTGIKEGDEANVLFKLNHEISRGMFKKTAAVFGTSFGISNLREIIEQTQNIECIITSSVRKDKTDPDRKYMNVKSIEVV